MTKTQQHQGNLISKYLYLENKQGSDNAKRFRKKMQKYKLWHYFTVYKYTNLEEEFPILLKNYLVSQKQNKTQHPIGILLDTVIPLSDITIIPPIPNYYDILFLENDIIEYKDLSNSFQDESKYWSKAKVKRSGNFIINGIYVDKILVILNKVNTMTEFFKYIYNNNEQYEPILVALHKDLYSTLQSKLTYIRQMEKESIEKDIKTLEEKHKYELETYYEENKEQYEKQYDKEENKEQYEDKLTEIKNKHDDELYELRSKLKDIDHIETDEIKGLLKEYEKDVNDIYIESNVIFTWSCNMLFSQHESYYVHNPSIKKNETKLRMDFISSDRINKEYELKRKRLYDGYKERINGLGILTHKFNANTKVSVSTHNLPGVSFIVPYTNPDNLYHAMITFLKMDYPSYKLEFIIVDDTNSEKKYKHVLPDDSRIRIINTSDKKNPDKKLTLGYKLNAGISYATYDIIMHLFDTSNYSLDLRRNVVEFIKMGKPCMMSSKVGIYPDKEYDIPDIGNMMYLKAFWRVNKWEDQYNIIEIELLYKFIYNRVNTIYFIPFIFMGFNVKEQTLTQDNETNKLPFKLDNLISEKLRESFKLYIESN